MSPPSFPPRDPRGQGSYAFPRLWKGSRLLGLGPIPSRAARALGAHTAGKRVNVLAGKFAITWTHSPAPSQSTG